jgi:Undecaprenyl-phosphate glucose phosphotransferase
MNRELHFWIPFLIIADALAIIGAWALAYWLRFHSGWLAIAEGGAIHPAEIYQVPLLFSLLLFYWIFQWQGAYQFPQPFWGREVRAVIRGLSLGGPLLVALIYLLYRDRYSRLVLALFLAFSFPLISLGRWLLRISLQRWLSRRSHSRRLVAICGDDQSGNILTEYMTLRPDAHLVRQIQYDNLPDLCLEKENPDEVLIIFPQMNAASLEKILRGLESELVDIKFIPDWGSFRLLGYEVEKTGKWPVIHLRRSPLRGWGSLSKRTMDLVLSLAVLLLALPVLGLIAFLIWITSGRPIFYYQQRMGYDGRLFNMYKFRSMVPGSDKQDAQWTRPDDPRRTRLGTLLRRLNLDELPQLYNILRGDMSFVGPRPERPHLIEEFKKSIPHYYLRHKVKAGLTGWAQIHGFRGFTSLEKRIEYDLFYIEHWSLGLDLKILWMTLFRAWINAY